MTDDLDRQLAAIASLGSWEWPEQARGILLKGLGSAIAERQILAITSLAENMDDEIAHQILDLLNDTGVEEAVQAEAVSGLSVVLEECELIGFDDPGDPPPISVSSMKKIIDRLRRLYLDSETPKIVRRRALESASRSPQGWQENAVRAAWASGDPQWQVSATFCMGLLRGFDSEIQQAFNSDSDEIKFEAIRAAGQSGIRALAAESLDLGQNEGVCPRRRYAAVVAIGYLAPPEAFPILEELQRHDDAELAELATEALAEAALWVYLDLDEEI